MKQILLILSCGGLMTLSSFARTSTPTGWTDDYDAACARAKAENKYIVADFTGSDWCGWCKRLDKEVFNTDTFRQEATNKYVLLTIDTPRNPSLLSPTAAAQNPKLVEKYHITGFPTVLMLDGDGRVVARVEYDQGGPVPYLMMLDKYAQEAPDYLKYLKPIEDILNGPDAEFLKELDAADADATAVYQKTKSKKEALLCRERHIAYEIMPKYEPIYDKLFEQAKRVEVPERLNLKKHDLISGQEVKYIRMKEEARAFRKKYPEKK